MTTSETIGRTRFGGELPADCDPLLDRPAVPRPGSLFFSNGRAGLSWFIAKRSPFASAAICAYTCPSVPQHLSALGLQIGLVDIGARSVAETVRSLATPCLVLVPAPFGLTPWLDTDELAATLGDEATVVVDAAQSATGTTPFPIPRRGAVLWCPRKTTTLGDGAVLALDGGATDEEAREVEALPEATEAGAAKMAARRIFAERRIESEAEGLRLNERSEHLFSGEPHRMSVEAHRRFGLIDFAEIERRRLANRDALADALGSRVEIAYAGDGVPFSLPVLVSDRDRLLPRLHERRVFATALWPTSVHDPERHPRADDMAARLISLPVDQRYRPVDMRRMAEEIIACL